MPGGIEGEGRRDAPTSHPPKPTEQSQPPPASPEGQPLPSVWEVLRHRAMIHEERSSNRMTIEEHFDYLREMNQLEDEIGEKGTPRDRLIIGLYNTMTLEPTGTLPNPVTFRELTIEEFQQFRSKVEPLSDEEIREELRTAEEGFERKKKSKALPDLPKGGPRV